MQIKKPLVRRRANRPCSFCSEKTIPDYKNVEVIAGYLSDRGKMVGPDRTGVCAKHQRRLAVAIKRARHLGLLPYYSGL